MTKPYLGLFLTLLLTVPVLAADTALEPQWYSKNAHGQVQIRLYFFHSQTCPHCKHAKQWLPQLAKNYPWLEIHEYEVSTQPENAKLYAQMAKRLGQVANSVPGFLFCEQIQVGYDNETGVGAFLQQQLEACYQKQTATAMSPSISSNSTPASAIPPLQIPLVGTIAVEQLSLPILTVVIAGLDAFNPCAFFVLLFLLSLLVHTRQRSRMLLIGGIFVFFSGAIYFLFMAAWLNLFLYTKELQIITAIAGLIAIIIALINIKDFFWFKAGISLSIPETAKPNLYQRMRQLVISTELIPMMISTVILAIVANTYELLCTAGFPMIYTRILTLNQLPESVYYLYLVLYNLIYVIPLLVIVLIFTYTLGSRKLAEAEGRALKLISGLMMLGLGGILLMKPIWLNNLLVSLAVIGASIGLSLIIIWGEKYYRRMST